MSILSHDEFCHIINRLEEIHNFEDEIDNICVKYDRHHLQNTYLDIDAEDLVMKVLETMFDCGDIIEWWIYETKFGHDKDNWIEEKGRHTYLCNASDLYNFLTKEQ